MTEQTRPRAINRARINQEKQALQSLVQEISGKLNPNYTAKIAFIEQLEAERADYDQFCQWALARGYGKPNIYPLRANGKIFQPGEAFYNKAAGTYKCIDRAWELYCNSRRESN